MNLTKTRWITVEEMRDRLSISKNKAYQIANSGSLDTVKIGSCLRINEDSLIRWLESLSHQKDQGGSEMGHPGPIALGVVDWGSALSIGLNLHAG